MQAGCNGIPMLIVGRFVTGICIGITSSQVPVYLAEIAKKESRGSITVIQQWSIKWGIFIIYLYVSSTPPVNNPAKCLQCWLRLQIHNNNSNSLISNRLGYLTSTILCLYHRTSVFARIASMVGKSWTIKGIYRYTCGYSGKREY